MDFHVRVGRARTICHVMGLGGVGIVRIVDMAPRIFVEAPRCPRCNDRVYAAEKVLGPMSKSYHKQCLKCVMCNKLLDSVSLLEHDGEPFCNNCHRTHLGQGKDKFGTAVPLRAHIDIPHHASPEARKIETSTGSSSGGGMHTSPSSGRRPLPVTPSGSTEPLRIPTSLSRQSLGSQSADASHTESMMGDEIAPTKLSSPSAPIIGGTPLCARCHKPVCMYTTTTNKDFAEQRQAAGHKWHRACLRCDGCHTSLDPGKVQDGPAELSEQGWPNTWCRMCYAKVRETFLRSTLVRGGSAWLDFLSPSHLSSEFRGDVVLKKINAARLAYACLGVWPLDQGPKSLDRVTYLGNFFFGLAQRTHHVRAPAPVHVAFPVRLVPHRARATLCTNYMMHMLPWRPRRGDTKINSVGAGGEACAKPRGSHHFF